MDLNTSLPKKEDNYMVDDEKKLSLNDKALNILFCSLDSIEFGRVSACETTKEDWEIVKPLSSQVFSEYPSMRI